MTILAAVVHTRRKEQSAIVFKAVLLALAPQGVVGGVRGWRLAI